MTLKQERLAQEILNPDNKTMKEAGIKAGYAVERGRTIYKQSTKRNIAKILEERGVNRESLTDVFKGIKDLALKKEDLSNANRSVENIARLYNLLKDTQIQQNTININDTIEALRVKPVDNSKGDVVDATTSNSKG